MVPTACSSSASSTHMTQSTMAEVEAWYSAGQPGYSTATGCSHPTLVTVVLVVVVVVVVVVVGQGPSAHTQRPAFRLLIGSKNKRVRLLLLRLDYIAVRYFFDSIIFCLYIVPPHRCTVGKDTRSTRVRPGRDGWCSSRLRDPACSDTRL